MAYAICWSPTRVDCSPLHNVKLEAWNQSSTIASSTHWSNTAPNYVFGNPKIGWLYVISFPTRQQDDREHWVPRKRSVQESRWDFRLRRPSAFEDWETLGMGTLCFKGVQGRSENGRHGFGTKGNPSDIQAICLNCCSSQPLKLPLQPKLNKTALSMQRRPG